VLFREKKNEETKPIKLIKNFKQSFINKPATFYIIHLRRFSTVKKKSPFILQADTSIDIPHVRIMDIVVLFISITRREKIVCFNTCTVIRFLSRSFRLNYKNYNKLRVTDIFLFNFENQSQLKKVT